SRMGAMVRPKRTRKPSKTPLPRSSQPAHFILGRRGTRWPIPSLVRNKITPRRDSNGARWRTFHQTHPSTADVITDPPRLVRPTSHRGATVMERAGALSTTPTRLLLTNRLLLRILLP